MTEATRTELEKLRQASAEATAAYHGHQNDGTLESDIVDMKLCKACTQARIAYEDALRKHIAEAVA